MNRELPDEALVRARFHAALEPLAQPSRPPLPGGAVVGHRDRRLRVALSALVVVAVAASTFAVLRVAVLERPGHPGGRAATGAAATPTPATPACRVPFVEYRPWSAAAPAHSTAGPGQAVAGFLSCSTGTFTTDPSAPAFGPADQDVAYVPALGWEVVPAGDTCFVSPDGTNLAYLDPAANSIGGTVHIVSAAGDQAIAIAGPNDVLLGWANDGIVVAPETDVQAAASQQQAGPLLGDAYLVDPITGGEQDLGFSAQNTAGVSGDAVWTWTSPSGLVQHDMPTLTATTWTMPPNELLIGITWHLLGFDGEGRPVVEGSGIGRFLLTGPGTATRLTTLPMSVTNPSFANVPLGPSGIQVLTIPEVEPLPGGGLVTLFYQDWEGSTDPYPVGIWTPASGWHLLASLAAAEMDGTPQFAGPGFTS
jgi:hypothetical protein